MARRELGLLRLVESGWMAVKKEEEAMGSCGIGWVEAPVLSVSIPWHCILGYLRYNAGRFGVSDLERSIAFYMEQLGFTLMTDHR